MNPTPVPNGAEKDTPETRARAAIIRYLNHDVPASFPRWQPPAAPHAADDAAAAPPLDFDALLHRVADAINEAMLDAVHHAARIVAEAQAPDYSSDLAKLAWTDARKQFTRMLEAQRPRSTAARITDAAIGEASS